jgi:hypothetical protein
MSAKKNRFDHLFQRKLFRITKAAKKHPRKASQKSALDFRSVDPRAEAIMVPDHLCEVTVQHVVNSHAYPNSAEFRERLRSPLRDGEKDAA